MNTEDKLVSAFKEYIDDAGVATGLTVVTGMFVSLVEALMEAQGHDVSKQIKIDGGNSRDITIHALKQEVQS